MYSTLLLPLAFFSHTLAVTLDSAPVIGSTVGQVTAFLGIPFAKPPTGNRRFRLPESIPPYTGTIQATSSGPSCPQQAFRNPLPQNGPANPINNTESEDCLTLNVIVPNGATKTSKLPVAVWIYGGAFEVGSTNMFDGGPIVERSIQLGQPVIYVSMNYRVNAFGFLASKEVKQAGLGNFGLQDQREALRWVQKYIGNFGGDPTKVTIWGESAGAFSSSLHMVANSGDNEGLFRGVFMQSGSPPSYGDISHGQPYYDALVRDTGCAGSSDTLACLRAAPYSTLKSAIDKTPAFSDYQSLVLAWAPRVDGVFLTDNPQMLVQRGKVADVPFITGDCDDEGTLFSFSTLNITTTSELKTYLKTIWLPAAEDSEINTVLSLYPDDPAQGSPYGTGTNNTLTPQFKRIASFQGDAVFQAPRRFFLHHRSSKQNTWAFLSKRFKQEPSLGSYHSSDLQNVYSGGELQDYLINFVNKLDPNGNGQGIHWPAYKTSTPNLLTLQDDPEVPVVISQDTYRVEGMEFLTSVFLKHPL